MTTEDDFHASLDANPDDHNTRLVFADWLQDRDDPRAEGYRALGHLPAAAHHYRTGEWGFDRVGQFAPDGDDLPSDWFDLMVRPTFSPHWSDHIHTGRTRREIEDTAALAFAGLPAGRRAGLLVPRQSPAPEAGRE